MKQLTLPGTVPQQPIWCGYKGGAWYIYFEYNGAWWVTCNAWDEPKGPYTQKQAEEKAWSLASESARY